MLAFVVSLLLLFLVGKWVVPMILAFLRRLGITEVFGVAFSEKKPNDNKRIESRISTCPTPRLTEEQRQIRMPKKVLELAENMENARSDERFRYCVVCSNKELLQCYAVQFYERVEQAFVIDHYGWVYYETPEDKSLNIQNCLHDALKICVNEKLPQDRFRAFVDFFDNPNKNFWFLFKLFIGVVIGVVCFSKIIGYFITNYYLYTIYSHYFYKHRLFYLFIHLKEQVPLKSFP